MEGKTNREKIEKILDNHYPEDDELSLKNYSVACEVDDLFQSLIELIEREFTGEELLYGNWLKIKEKLK